MSRLIDADMLSPDRDYYENSYNGGYDAVSCQQIDNAQTVPAIPLDKVKQAREEIENEVKFWSDSPLIKSPYYTKDIKSAKANSYKHCLEILDELIAESEEK